MPNQRGSIYALATTPDFVYQQQGRCCAACANGLYLSDHHATDWHKIQEDLNPPAVTAATFAGNADLFAGAFGGVLRSGDNGKNWHFAPLATPQPVISCIVVSPNFAHDGTILAGTLEDGVFRSEDRGRVWSSANFGLLDLSVLSLAISPTFADDETIFAGTESGVFRSTNGGRAWRETPFPMEYAPVLCLAYGQGETLFAGTEAHGVYASRDNGQTWARLDGVALTGAVNQIILSTSDPSRLLVLHDDGLLISRDAGQNWNTWNEVTSSGITAVVAPDGIHDSAHLLVGFDDGRVLVV